MERVNTERDSSLKRVRVWIRSKEGGLRDGEATELALIAESLGPAVPEDFTSLKLQLRKPLVFLSL